MKKLNLIVFTLLIFFANNVHSQEKQNDATVEETINWLNEFAIKNMINNNSQIKKPLSFSTSKSGLKYHYAKSEYDVEQVSLDFIKDKTFKLKTSSYDGTYIVNIYGESYNTLYGIFRFGTNKDYALRTFKAFQHLFYLLEWKVECINELVDENKF